MRFARSVAHPEFVTEHVVSAGAAGKGPILRLKSDLFMQQTINQLVFKQNLTL